MDAFGDRLKAVRQQAGFTQEQLAETSGVSLGAVREYEQHKRDPLLSNALRLARALKQPLQAFLPDEEGVQTTDEGKGKRTRKREKRKR